MKKVIIMLILLPAVMTFGAELLVPSQYPTIQSAVDAAVTGDIVIISPGTYTGEGNRNVSISGKTITVRSTDPNNPAVVSSTIIDCNSVTRGFTLTSNSILDGLTITNGIARYSSGGGLYVSSSYSPFIHNCVITKSSASYGGGINSEGGLTISNCTITGNQAPLGGGIYINKGPVTINNCVITENSSSSYGGGIYLSLEGGLTISNCAITGNQASNGGGIYIKKGSVAINNCVITENFSSSNGGGIYAFNSSYPAGNLTISRGTIAGNQASNGGGIYLNYGLVNIDNSFIAANASQINGAGVYVSSAGAVVQYCTFAGNTAAGTGGGVYMDSYSSGFSGFYDIFWGNTDSGSPASPTAQISPYLTSWTILNYSCIQDADADDANIPCGGVNNFNIDDNPLFVREPNDGGDGWGVGDNDDYGDLHLLPNSPCIEAGNPFFRGINLTDIDGQTRIIGQSVDMGADEYEKIIIITKPKAGDVWATGSERLIQWLASGVSEVDILFSGNNGADWETIAESVTDANNSYLWEIPNGIDSNQYIISILPADGDPNVLCIESEQFTIKPYPRRPQVPFGWYRRLPIPDLSNNKGPRFGCVKWVFDTAGSVFSKAAVTRPNRRGGYKIYAGCETGQIYALNKRGLLLWSYDTDAPIVGSPGIGYYDMVYVGAGGRLYAFDRDGELRWTRDTDAPISSQPVAGYDGKIYVSSLDGTLYAIRPDGTCVWTFATKGPGRMRGAIFTSPVISKSKFGRRQRGGDIYIAGFYDPNLYALDAETGDIKWVCNFE
ncbi:MAG: PQQ-binding-like beta-propeller repeat protein, partial [Sedimentisphaerales bacterium]|nr:PQQ-binding-like beta-propeller repeat protein [Sedimentisphaerales bacterium]